MSTKYLLPLLLSLSLVACIPKEPPPPLAGKVPFKVLVHFSSDVPNTYYVLSGPFQSYQRFAFNAAFQRRLEDYASTKSDPLATQTLELSVHITSLQTSYDRLGTLPGGEGQPGVMLAGLGRSGGWPMADADSPLERFDDLPEQITKTATLLAEVGLTLPGQSEFREAIVARSVQVLERWDMGLGTHDYQPLIVEVQNAALRDIDRVLHRALARELAGGPNP